jgi:TolB protein
MFYSDRPPSDTYGIFVMNGDGSQPVLVSDGPDDGLNPAWSPDGKSVAYVSICCGDSINRQEIYLVDVDGSNRRRLIADLAHFPEWSPDGSALAYYGSPNRDTDVAGIYVSDSDGTEGVLVTTDGRVLFQQQPKWSPDGLALAYADDSGGNGESQIFVVNRDGSGATRLSDRPADSPAWSPK